MFKINQRKKKGMTLIEMMISVSLSLTLMGFITNFLMNFTDFANQNVIKNDLTNDLRIAQIWLEKEILPGRAVLSSYVVPNTTYYPTAGTVSTGPNTLILSLPVYKVGDYTPAATQDPANIATTGSRDPNKNDILIIEWRCLDGSAASNCTTATMGKLKLYCIPAGYGGSGLPGTEGDGIWTRHIGIKGRVIYPSVANPANLNLVGVTTGSTTYPIFTYYNFSGSPTTTYADAVTVKTTLYAMKEYGQRNGAGSFNEKKEIDLRLRNFGG